MVYCNVIIIIYIMTSLLKQNMGNYDLSFIYNLKQEGFDYEIPERTMYLINKISGQVGAPTYSRTPIFKKRLNTNHNNTDGVSDPFKMGNNTDNGKDMEPGFKVASGKRNNKNNKHGQNKGKQNTRVINDNEWGNIRTFETTKIEKNEEGIEKELNKIRIQLNKLTNNTFNDVKMELLDIINSFINNVDETDLLKVSNMIFDVGSSNGFYAKQYSLLYKELMSKYDIMTKVFELQFKDIIGQITNVKNANAEEDYDLFCVVNSQNDKNKSITRFMSFMFNEDMISLEDMYELLSDVIELFTYNVREENSSFICEHLTDIIFEIIQVSGDKLKLQHQEKYEETMSIMEDWTEPDKKKYPSYTNKTKFKLMDIIELME